MSMISEPRQCPKCGASIPVEAPQGLCPKCLMAQASIPTNAGTEARNRPIPPTQEELAAAFPQLEILELVGQGGMGFVFKARQPKLERLVALKLLPQSLATDSAFAERFTREGRVLARLNHPNIVTIHDFGEANGFFYLLMEFVDGVNLRQAMRTGRFTPEQALAVVPKICDALQFAHNEGILHRDIKPENILLDAKGRVKIADFGIAKLVGEPHSEANLTASGGTLGTPHYMAPEQIEKPSAVDHRADIYSLGVVFYEMLTGELPLGKFQPPSQKVHVDVRLDDVVLHALEKEPERRYQQVSEVKTAVDTIAVGPARGGSPAPVPVVASAGSETARPDRFWKWFAVVVLGMIAIPVVIAVLAILAAIVIPNLFRSRQARVVAQEAQRAEEHVRQAERQALNSALSQTMGTQLVSQPSSLLIESSTNPYSGLFAKRSPTSAEELRLRVEQAFQKRDTQAVSALFNWSGVSENTKSFLLKPLEGLERQPTNEAQTRVSLVPLPADYEAETVWNGTRYTPNVSLLGMIGASLRYVKEGTNYSWGTQIPYGRIGDAFYLAGTAGQKLYESKTKDKLLYIMIMSISTQTPPSSFTGTLAYVQNGQVIHADLSGKGGRRKTVPGDHVESCVVQKTSDGPGSIQVTIYEDGKRVFDSGQVESQEPITYTNSLGGAQTKPSVGEAGELSAATAGRFEFRWVARDEETNSPADWLADASGTDSSRTLCILKEVLLDGDAVASAGFARFEPDHREISVLLTDEGGRKFAALTAANIGRRLAIVWNGRVLSAPVIRDAITSRQVMITSNLRDEESLLLVNVLNHRNLPERAADDQSNIQAELRDAKTQLAELRRRGYTDSHPSVALLRDRIKKLEGK